jgi:hypothetical protein
VPADCSVTARREDGRRPLARAPSHDTGPGCHKGRVWTPHAEQDFWRLVDCTDI